MAKAGKVTHIQKGVRECLKEGGIDELLLKQAAKAAERCNSMMSPELRARGAEYVAEPKGLGYTAGAVVRCGGSYHGHLAAIDNAKNNTLKKGCGV